MKKTIVIAAFFALAVSLFAGSGIINVQDFGAKGDGSTDDTAAIQAALDAAWKQRIDMKCGPYFHGNGVDAVVFPKGHYIISDTLHARIPIIRGEGHAFIHQKNRNKDIIYYDLLHQGSIENLNFVGGHNHISFWNNNLDCGFFTVQHCKFYDADGVCVETRAGTNSTFFIIRDCDFIYNRQAVVSNCDKTSIVDCWIETLPAMENMAAIVNVHGILSVDRLLGVPLCEKAGQRWIDNIGGSVYCNDCRFGGEGGGITPIWNFAKYNSIPGTGSVIVLRNCEVSAESNYRARTAVYCIEVPNVISVENCALRGVPPIKINKKLDMSGYFDAAYPGALSYRISNNVGLYADQFPEELRAPKMKGKPQIEGQLSEAETKQLLQKKLANFPKSAVPEDARSSFVPSAECYTLDAYMDTTAEKNSERLAMGFDGNRCLLMWRAKYSGWPHVEVRNMEVDLDKYPIFQIVYSTPENSPLDVSVRLIDEDDEEQYLLCGQSGPKTFECDLRKWKLKGKKHVTLRIYYIGSSYVPPKNGESKFHYENAVPGDFIVLDRVRFTAPQ